MTKKIANSQYNVSAPTSLPVRIAGFQRRRMFRLFMESISPRSHETILDVGATSDQSYESSNYIEAWYPNKHNITALGIDDASFLETKYPGVKFVRGNGLDLQFPERQYDVVHSSAVLEHVGSAENQLKFILECARVAKRGFFLTTPNRWFPIEFHTTLPLLHWLPPRMFRWVLRRLDMEFFASESNLNLLTARELREMTSHVPGYDVRVRAVRLGGLKSNLIIEGVRLEEMIR